MYPSRPPERPVRNPIVVGGSWLKSISIFWNKFNL